MACYFSVITMSPGYLIFWQKSALALTGKASDVRHEMNKSRLDVDFMAQVTDPVKQLGVLSAPPPGWPRAGVYIKTAPPTGSLPLAQGQKPHQSKETCPQRYVVKSYTSVVQKEYMIHARSRQFMYCQINFQTAFTRRKKLAGSYLPDHIFALKDSI